MIARSTQAGIATFDDLARLTPPVVQALLRQVHKDQLALALHGASEPLRHYFFANMSERAAQLLRETMAGLGVVAYQEIDGAQVAVMTRAKQVVEAEQLAAGAAP